MPTRTDTGVGRLSLTKAEVLARGRRFGALRAAQRALVPSVRGPEKLPPIAAVRELRDDLQALIGELRESGGTINVAGDRVAAIDAALDRYAIQLREVADGIAISQFRASLTEADFERREEVAALLDLLLEEDDGIVKRLTLIDYLITAL